MKNVISVAGVLVAVSLAVAVSTATPQPPVAPGRPTVFSSLKVGQAVTVKRAGGIHVVGTLDGIEAGTHTVLEVGPDFLSVRDMAGLTETRIPVSAISAVVHNRVK